MKSRELKAVAGPTAPAQPMRLAIVSLLAKAGPSPADRWVDRLTNDMTPSNLTAHMSILNQVQLVESDKRGRLAS